MGWSKGLFAKSNVSTTLLVQIGPALFSDNVLQSKFIITAFMAMMGHNKEF